MQRLNSFEIWRCHSSCSARLARQIGQSIQVGVHDFALGIIKSRHKYIPLIHPGLGDWFSSRFLRRLLEINFAQDAHQFLMGQPDAGLRRFHGAICNLGNLLVGTGAPMTQNNRLP